MTSPYREADRLVKRASDLCVERGEMRGAIYQDAFRAAVALQAGRLDDARELARLVIKGLTGREP